MSFVTLLWLLIYVWSSAIHAQDPLHGEQCADFLEIGKQTSLQCAIENITDILTLQVKLDNDFVNVSSCTASGECTDFMSPDYTSEFLGPQNVEGEEMEVMQVVIKGRIGESNFRCVHNGLTISEQCIEMYGRPSKPLCDPPALVNSNTDIGIPCTSDRVFPDAFMSVEVVQNGKTFYTDFDVSYESELFPSVAYPGHYVVNTTALIHLSSLEPDSYQFAVRMHANVSDFDLASKTIVSEITHFEHVTINLTAPEMKLSSDCPLDPYKIPVTCTCELTTLGNPPGQARWYSRETGQVVGNENSDDRSSALIITANSSDSEILARYVCLAETVLNVSSTSTDLFTPVQIGRPTRPMCELPALDNLKGQISVSCTTDNVYPDVFPSVSVIRHGKVYDADISFESELTASWDYPGYYVDHTTFILHLSRTEPGSYVWGIRMHPNISDDLSLARRILPSRPVLFQLTNLTAPEVSLSSDCPVSRNITSGICKCELTTTGYPPGQARWYTQSGQVVGSENFIDRSSSLILSQYSQDPSASYECRAESLLNVSSPSTVVFSPMFAAIPHKDRNLLLLIILPVIAAVVIIAIIVILLIWSMKKRNWTLGNRNRAKPEPAGRGDYANVADREDTNL